jgi:NAD(P)-dependent dehydrogenase (short-subunit alcohol dehydrogenase family)
VAIAFAREGADILISYLCEHEDANETKRWIEEAGRGAMLVPGDIQDSAHCRRLVDQAVTELGGLDILVNNAAHQATFKSLDEISDEEWEATFRTNIHAMFWLARAAVPHMRKGSSIINTASINADVPNPTLLPYATTKGAIHNFTGGLAQILRVSHPGLGVGAPNLSGGSSSRLAARPAKQQEARRTDRSTLRKCSSW